MGETKAGWTAGHWVVPTVSKKVDLRAARLVGTRVAQMAGTKADWKADQTVVMMASSMAVPKVVLSDVMKAEKSAALTAEQMAGL